MTCTKHVYFANLLGAGMSQPQTPNHNCEQTLCKKNRNRTHQDQRSTGAMNLPWLRSLRGWNTKLLVAVGDVRLRDVVYHTGSRPWRQPLPAIIHCSIVCRMIITFCRSLLHINSMQKPSAFLLHILSGNPQRNRHCLGLASSGLHKFLDVCRNILFAWL